MAALGAGKMMTLTASPFGAPKFNLSSPNLFSRGRTIASVLTLPQIDSKPLNVPIMPEGFVTDTGLAPPSDPPLSL